MKIPERKLQHNQFIYLGSQERRKRYHRKKVAKYLRNRPSLVGKYVPWKLRKRIQDPDLEGKINLETLFNHKYVRTDDEPHRKRIEHHSQPHEPAVVRPTHTSTSEIQYDDVEEMEDVPVTFGTFFETEEGDRGEPVPQGHPMDTKTYESHPDENRHVLQGSGGSFRSDETIRAQSDIGFEPEPAGVGSSLNTRIPEKKVTHELIHQKPTADVPLNPSGKATAKDAMEALFELSESFLPRPMEQPIPGPPPQPSSSHASKVMGYAYEPQIPTQPSMLDIPISSQGIIPEVRPPPRPAQVKVSAPPIPTAPPIPIPVTLPEDPRTRELREEFVRWQESDIERALEGPPRVPPPVIQELKSQAMVDPLGYAASLNTIVNSDPRLREEREDVLMSNPIGYRDLRTTRTKEDVIMSLIERTMDVNEQAIEQVYGFDMKTSSDTIAGRHRLKDYRGLIDKRDEARWRKLHAAKRRLKNQMLSEAEQQKIMRKWFEGPDDEDEPPPMMMPSGTFAGKRRKTTHLFKKEETESVLAKLEDQAKAVKKDLAKIKKSSVPRKGKFKSDKYVPTPKKRFETTLPRRREKKITDKKKLKEVHDVLRHAVKDVKRHPEDYTYDDIEALKDMSEELARRTRRSDRGRKRLSYKVEPTEFYVKTVTRPPKTSKKQKLILKSKGRKSLQKRMVKADKLSSTVKKVKS